MTAKGIYTLFYNTVIGNKSINSYIFKLYLLPFKFTYFLCPEITGPGNIPNKGKYLEIP